MDDLTGHENDEPGVERLEFIVGTDAPQRRGLKRLAQPEIRVSLDVLPDGSVRDRSWSFAVAYEIPADRRASAGADAISLLWDKEGWHVEGVTFDDDPKDPRFDPSV